jgi:hypothetical protein
MNITLLASALIVCHFVGDWLLQSRYIAENKSRNFWVLINHLAIVHAILIIGLYIVGYITRVNLFYVTGALIVNTILHGLIDWHIWKFYVKYYHDPLNPDKKPKAFYNTIAIDQSLHLICLMYFFL